MNTQENDLEHDTKNNLQACSIQMLTETNICFLFKAKIDKSLAKEI